MAQSPSPPRRASSHPVGLADAEVDRAVDLLHDGPVQSLAFAHFAAEAAVRGGDPAAARDAVRSALVELRRLLWHLRPRGGDGAGLREVLGQLSVRLVEAGRAPLHLAVDEGSVAGLEPPAVSTAYRLVQAVALAGPAADAVLVRVGLEPGGTDLVLDLTGTGLDLAAWTGRVHAVGGRLSSTGSGYRLVLPVPVPQPEVIS